MGGQERGHQRWNRHRGAQGTGGEIHITGRRSRRNTGGKWKMRRTEKEEQRMRGVGGDTKRRDQSGIGVCSVLEKGEITR